MSKHRVAVLKVVTNQLSVTAAAAEVGLSRGHLHRLLRRYREGGLEALEARSRRPRTSPGRTPEVHGDVDPEVEVGVGHAVLLHPRRA